MKKLNFLLALIAICLAGAALYRTSPEGLERTLVNNPRMLLNASSAVEQLLQEEAAAKQQEAAKSAEAAIEENIELFNNAENDPFVGPKDAAATVVEFFDFSCGYCHALAPTLEGLIEANADVKFVFKPLAFLSPASEYAAKALVAANIQGKGYDFYKEVMAISGLNEEKINDAAKKAGVDVKKMKEDMESETVEAVLRTNVDLAQKANINGVPFLIINGKIMRSVSSEELQDAINAVK